MNKKYIYTRDENRFHREYNNKREYVGNKSFEPVGDKKTALVMGAGGFIGSHMVKRLKNEGYWVRGVDLKDTEFSKTMADDFIIGDLTDPRVVGDVMK